MRLLAAVIVLNFLCGCAATPVGSPMVAGPALETLLPVSLTKAQIEAIQVGARKSLKDPESARFGTIIAGHDSKGVITVCGYLNAKNSYGGYVGEKPFTGILGGKEKNWVFAVAGMGGTDIDTTVVNKICGDQGLYL